jgi:hypothetical protein
MIRNLTKMTLVSATPFHAISFPNRLRGMIGRKFSAFDAMVFPRCSSVHTFFMGIPLDLVFLSGDSRVLKTVSDARPWRPCFRCSGAKSVVELPSGTVARTGTEPGDQYDLSMELDEGTRKVWNEIYKKRGMENIAVPMGEK